MVHAVQTLQQLPERCRSIQQRRRQSAQFFVGQAVEGRGGMCRCLVKKPGKRLKFAWLPHTFQCIVRPLFHLAAGDQ